MMKYVLIALLGLSATVAATSCSEDKNASKEEDAPVVPVVDPKGLKIAFYYSDSLRTGFKYFQHEDSMMNKKAEAFQKDLMGRQNTLAGMEQRFAEAYKTGTATSESLQKMEAEINRKREQYMAYQQTRGTELEKETSEKLTVLSKKIEVAGEKYCKKYGVDMLLIHGQGGQINFIDKRMDVTKSFIDFLNHQQEQMEKDMGEK